MVVIFKVYNGNKLIGNCRWTNEDDRILININCEIGIVGFFLWFGRKYIFIFVRGIRIEFNVIFRFSDLFIVEID